MISLAGDLEGTTSASILQRLSDVRELKAPGSLSDIRDRVQILEEKMDFVQGKSIQVFIEKRDK